MPKNSKISYTGYGEGKEIKCVEKQVGWDVIHYKDGTCEPVEVEVRDGYKRGRVIL